MPVPSEAVQKVIFLVELSDFVAEISFENILNSNIATKTRRHQEIAKNFLGNPEFIGPTICIIKNNS
jgi:hypothetical protein